MLVTVASELRMVIVMSAIRIGVIRMKNKEKYEKEIVEIVCNCEYIAVDKETESPVICNGFDCDKCMFRVNGNCRSRYFLKEWAESEYVELPVISKSDRTFLDYIKEEYKYITSDEDGNLFAWSAKPKKGLILNEWLYTSSNTIGLYAFNLDLPMVKCEDSEPWLIKDLKKLEVVENYE